MSRVIYFGMPAHGHVNPSIPLIKELIDRGEEVIYYCNEDFRKKIEETGALFKSYDNRLFDVINDVSANFLLHSYLLMVATKRILNELMEDITALEPDYIIHDSQCPWGRYISKILDVPAISIITTFAFPPSNVFAIKSFAKAVAKMFLLHFRYFFKAQKLCNSLEKEYEVSYGSALDTFNNEEGLNIVFTSRELQPNAEKLISTYKFVGPSIPAGCEVTRSDSDIAKTIYISLGTIFNSDIGFYKSCIEALGHTDFKVIMSLGGRIDVKRLGEIPANFEVRNIVNQLEVLKKADIFITHAGMNSVHEALFFNVPMIAVPQQPEQVVVADRIVETGCGIKLENSMINKDVIKNTVKKIFESDNYKINCKTISKSLIEAGGYKKAADEIQYYINSIIRT